LDDLGYTYQLVGDHRNALIYMDEALDVRKRLLGSSHPDVARSRVGVARSLEALGNYDRALELRYSAVDRCKAATSDDLDCAPQFGTVAIDATRRGDYAFGQELVARLLNTGLTRIQLGDPDSLPPEILLASIEMERGNFSDAVDLAARGATSIVNEAAATHFASAWTHMERARIELHVGHAEDSRNALSLALEQFKYSVPDEHHAAAAFHQAKVALRLGKPALELFEDAVRNEKFGDYGWSSKARNSRLTYIRILIAQSEWDHAQREALAALGELARDRTALPHLQVGFFELLARAQLGRMQPEQALEQVAKGRYLFDPSQVLDNRLAALDFVEAQALWMLADSPAQKRDALALAQAALERYRSWDFGAENQIREVSAWIRAHGGRPFLSI
jgi:hypothetical protein